MGILGSLGIEEDLCLMDFDFGGVGKRRVIFLLKVMFLVLLGCGFVGNFMFLGVGGSGGS